MIVIPELTTKRLRLRAWQDADLAPFASMNADPAVMQHMPATLTRSESDALVARIRADLESRGFGLWAVEVVGGAPFIGFVGLATPSFEVRFTPCVEIGWRLGLAHWGAGYATEAAHEVLAAGFQKLGLEEIVSFTVRANHRSRSVMTRLGMHSVAEDDFDHPALPLGHPLRRHVLYRLARREWVILRERASARTRSD